MTNEWLVTTQAHGELGPQMRPRSQPTSEDGLLIERGLRWTEGFAGWSAAAMGKLLAQAHLLRLRRGDALSGREGEASPVFALVSGYLLVSRVAGDESRSVVGLFGPGTLIGVRGELAIQDGATLEFRVHEDAVLVRMPSVLLFELLDAEPKLWAPMARMLLRQSRQMLGGLLTHRGGALGARVSATIDNLATHHGAPRRSGLALRTRLSQADLASMLQVSRQTVNRELGRLEIAGVICRDYNSITILDRAKLRTSAGYAAAV